MINQDFMNDLQFTLEDLEMNRAGKISPAQQARLKRLRLSSMGVPIFFVIASVLILYISMTDYSKFNEPSRIVFILLALLLVVVVFGFAVCRWRRITEDMHSAHVEVLNGTPRLSGLNVKGFS